MARTKNDILSDLRLANFNKSPIKDRLALLLELDAGMFGIADLASDIADHAAVRLVDIEEEVRRICDDGAENHKIAIKNLVSEFKIYAKHPAIKEKHRQSLRHIRNTIEPLWGDIVTKEEDVKLAELHRRFKEVSPVDWSSNDWFQKADQNRRTYEQILQACEITWHARSEQAEKLKREIRETRDRIRDEVMRRS